MKSNLRIMALDLGEKTCGIAWSDLLHITAQPQENFRFETHNWQQLVAHLQEHYLEQVSTVVVGLPLLPSGDDSTTTKMVREFVAFLKSKIHHQVVFQEEYRSTKKAQAIMQEAGLNRKRQKQHKDKLAAVIILQDYLERI